MGFFILYIEARFELKIIATNISKSYDGLNFVFQNISFELSSGEALGILGKNGSGKTTLLKLLAGVLQPTRGKVSYFFDGKELDKNKFKDFLGFVSPYLVLFEEFLPLEFLKILCELKHIAFNEQFALTLLEEFSLINALDKEIKEFSSGMKQRLKFVSALIHKPLILLLDEPFSNLDSQGIECVTRLITDYKNDGKIVIIASNDKREIELTTKQIQLDKVQ